MWTTFEICDFSLSLNARLPARISYASHLSARMRTNFEAMLKDGPHAVKASQRSPLLAQDMAGQTVSILELFNGIQQFLDAHSE